MHNNSQIEGARNKSSIQSIDKFVEGSSVIGDDHANQNSKGRNFSEKQTIMFKSFGVISPEDSIGNFEPENR